MVQMSLCRAFQSLQRSCWHEWLVPFKSFVSTAPRQMPRVILEWRKILSRESFKRTVYYSTKMERQRGFNSSGQFYSNIRDFVAGGI